MVGRQGDDRLALGGSSSLERARPSAPVQGPPEADVLTLLAVFVRRWYVIVPGIVLAVVAAYLINDAAVPEYEADGALLLVSGADGDGQDADATDSEGQAGAGEGEAAPGVAVSGRAVAEVVMSDRVRLELLEQGLGAQYTVAYEEAGSLLRVQARSVDESEVVPTAEAVLEAIQVELDARQDAAGVPPEERLGLDLLAQPSAPVPEQVEDDQGGFSTRYVARGVVALVPTVYDDGYGPNPLSADRATAQLMARVMNSDEMQPRIVGEDPTTEYRVRQDRQDAAPFLYVSTSGTDPEQVLATFGATRSALQDELDRRQQAAQASPDSWVAIETVSAPAEATTLGGEGLRPALTVFALITALAFGLALLLEAVMNAVRRRREPEPRLPLLYGGVKQPDNESGLERTR